MKVNFTAIHAALWKKSSVHQRSSHEDVGRVVHVEHVDRGPANRRATNKPGAMPAKMITPSILARMKKPHSPLRKGIFPCNIWPLAEVAMITGEGQIPECCPATVLFGDDVVDLVRRAVVPARHSTIFAEATRAPPNASLKGRRRHQLPDWKSSASGAPSPGERLSCGLPGCTDRPRSALLP